MEEDKYPLVFKDVFYDTYTHTLFYKTPPEGSLGDPYCKRHILVEPVTEEILQLPCISIPGYTYGMEQFHYCFGHAYADTTLPLISILDEIDPTVTAERDWKLFVFRHEFFYTNHHATPIIENFQKNYIDLSGQRYKGPFLELQTILTKHPVLFEDLYSCALFHFDTLVLGGIAEYHRAVHNHNSKYPGRRCAPPLFTDKEILAFSEKGKAHIAQTLGIPSTVPRDPSKIQVLLINRRHNRMISEEGVSLISEFFQKKGAPYELYGPFFLEMIPLEKQIELFLQADLIISPHGSALLHTMWSRTHSFLLEVFQTKDTRDPIFQSYTRAYRLSYARYIEEPNKKLTQDSEIYLTRRILPALEQICSILHPNRETA